MEKGDKGERQLVMLESLACICGVSLKLNTEIQKFTFTDCFFIMISFWFYFVFFFFLFSSTSYPCQQYIIFSFNKHVCLVAICIINTNVD